MGRWVKGSQYVQTRNDRKVRRVIGCELKRQLREPGAGWSGCCSSMMRLVWVGMLQTPDRRQLLALERCASLATELPAVRVGYVRLTHSFPGADWTSRSRQQLHHCQALIPSRCSTEARVCPLHFPAHLSLSLSGRGQEASTQFRVSGAAGKQLVARCCHCSEIYPIYCAQALGLIAAFQSVSSQTPTHFQLGWQLLATSVLSVLRAYNTPPSWLASTSLQVNNGLFNNSHPAPGVALRYGPCAPLTTPLSTLSLTPPLSGSHYPSPLSPPLSPFSLSPPNPPNHSLTPSPSPLRHQDPHKVPQPRFPRRQRNLRPRRLSHRH